MKSVHDSFMAAKLIQEKKNLEVTEHEQTQTERKGQSMIMNMPLVERRQERSSSPTPPQLSLFWDYKMMEGGRSSSPRYSLRRRASGLQQLQTGRQ